MAKRSPIASHPQAAGRDNSTGPQAYILAVFCLILGVALGYLFRGSASPAVATTEASVATDGGSPHGRPTTTQLTPEQQKAILDQSAAPLLAILTARPDNFDAIMKLGNLYYDAQQFPEAVKYYRLAVKSQPQNPDLLTDLGTSLWYTGDADAAIVEFQQALKYRPDHPGTLFNLGVVRWQGKMDPKGAVQAWEELLQRNPDYPQKKQIQEYIERAKQHAKG